VGATKKAKQTCIVYAHLTGGFKGNRAELWR